MIYNVIYFAGVSVGLISKIVKEKKTAEETGTKITSPGTSRQRKCGYIHVDAFDDDDWCIHHGVIRRRVHAFYSIRKEIPKIRKSLRNMGFRYRKTQTNRKVLIERNEITAWRAKYLQEKKKNDRSSPIRRLLFT